MKKRTSFQVFISVVKALFLREIQTRFGTQRMGYFWAVVDPMVMILMFGSIHSYRMSSTSTGYDYMVFLAIGFLPFNLFRSVVKASMGAFKSNEALFVYKQVKPFDTLVARLGVEGLQITVVTLFFIALGIYFDYDLTVKDFNMVIFAVVWLVLFGFSLGLFLGVIATFYENLQKIVGLVMFPLFFLSGLFYTVASLPQFAREILWYNPVIHFIELIHGSFFQSLDIEFVDFTYMMFWTFIPLYIGLFFYRRSERKIISL